MIVPDDYLDRKVCIMGLGYVGLTMATVMADVGFEVLGVEIRDDVLEKLGRGEAHFYEPGLANQLKKVTLAGRLRAVKHLSEQDRANIYIITVGTPLGDNGKARMDIVENVSREVAMYLREGDMVIMRSTLKIGTTRDVVKPILDAAGVNYDLAFCPERTLEGQAMVELRRLPQIVGGMTSHASVRASQLFQLVTSTVVRVSDPETAEMIKLIDNAQRDVQFAYANEVARLCDAVGISANEVISAGKLGYARTNLPMPGPVGGPCLEKDTYILAEGLQRHGIQPEISLTARHLNERQMQEVAVALRRTAETLPGFAERPVITVAGVAFKGQPATDDLRGTTARPLIGYLREAFPNAILRGFDAVVPPDEIRGLGLEPVADLESAFDNTSLLVLHNNHLCFAGMAVEFLAERMARPGIIYDFWNHFAAPDLELPRGVGYMALGSHAWFRLSEGR